MTKVKHKYRYIGKRKSKIFSLSTSLNEKIFSPMSDLKIQGRTLWLMRSHFNTDYVAKVVLTKSMFNFIYSWLLTKTENGTDDQKKALKYWLQAKSYYIEGVDLRSDVKPLLNYYSALNMVKCLLSLNEINVNNIAHGVSWESSNSPDIESQYIKFLGSGALCELCKITSTNSYNGGSRYSLKTLFYNLAFIHRAYIYTFTDEEEIFLPLKSTKFKKIDNSDKFTFTFDLRDVGTLNITDFIPTKFEFTTENRTDWDDIKEKSVEERIQWGAKNKKLLFKFKTAEKWCGDDKGYKIINDTVSSLHRKVRHYFQYISASTPLWYLKKQVVSNPDKIINHSSLAISFSVMHCLSEMVRYKPDLYNDLLESKYGWLLTEFVELGIEQFVDEISSEISGLNIMRSGVASKR